MGNVLFISLIKKASKNVYSQLCFQKLENIWNISFVYFAELSWGFIVAIVPNVSDAKNHNAYTSRFFTFYLVLYNPLISAI